MSDIDKVRPAVPILLDRERKLCFDFNAMIAYEEATGKSLLEVKNINVLFASPTLKSLRALLWACLVDDDETLTLKQVGSMLNLDKDRLAGIVEKLLEAVKAGLPEQKVGASGKNPLANRAARRKNPHPG